MDYVFWSAFLRSLVIYTSIVTFVCLVLALSRKIRETWRILVRVYVTLMVYGVFGAALSAIVMSTIARVTH